MNVKVRKKASLVMKTHQKTNLEVGFINDSSIKILKDGKTIEC